MTPAPTADQTPTTPTPEKPAEGETPADDAQLLFDDKLKEGDDNTGDTKKDGEGEGDAEKKDGEEGDKPEAIKFEDFKIDENLIVDDETKTSLLEIVNDDKLTKGEMVQKLIDLHSKNELDRAQQFQKFVADQKQSVINDPELGGDNLKKTVAEADAAIRRFCKDPAFGGSDEMFKEMQDYLTLMGLGNSKVMIKFFRNVARATGNDSFIDGNSGGGASEKPLENILFPNMKK